MAIEDNAQMRREEIYSAAEQVFARYGYDAARMDEIAQLAGVGKGTVYLYFPSKQELFISLVETRTAEFVSLLEERLGILTDIEQYLRGLVGMQVEFYNQHSGLLFLLFQNMDRFGEDFQTRMTHLKHVGKELISNALKGLLPAGYPIAPDKLYTMISGSTASLVAEYFQSGEPVRSREIIELIIDAYLPGIPQIK